MTKSETENYVHYGFEYSVISKEDYLNSNAAGLHRVTLSRNNPDFSEPVTAPVSAGETA